MKISRGLRYFKKYGVKKTIKKAISRFASEVYYKKWRLQHIPTRRELKEQQETEFNYRPCFSIVVPLYKTPENYLESLVNSVKQQTYENWELCLSDGSGIDSPLKEILSRFEKGDDRIKIIHNKKQLRISANTNEALKAATGDFVIFADHDDLLSPDALFECAKALNKNRSIDLLYSDEDKVTMNGKTYFNPHFKSDFNIDQLRSTNYISHLFIAKRSILDQVGHLNPEFDGSQDYDLILRCVEYTQNIHHIPKVLYHWRAHKDSTADNPENKLYAYDAGERALRAHYDRIGLNAVVSPGKSLGYYKTTR